MGIIWVQSRGYSCYLFSSLNSLTSISYDIFYKLRNLVEGTGSRVLREEDLGESSALQLNLISGSRYLQNSIFMMKSTRYCFPIFKFFCCFPCTLILSSSGLVNSELKYQISLRGVIQYDTMISFVLCLLVIEPISRSSFFMIKFRFFRSFFFIFG